jgi:hypothetical protein
MTRLIGLTDDGQLETIPAESGNGLVSIPTLRSRKFEATTSLNLPHNTSPANPYDITILNGRLTFHDGATIRTVATLEDINSVSYTRKDASTYIALGASSSINATTTNAHKNRLYLLPFVFGRDITTSTVSIYITTNAPSTIRVGVYSTYYDTTNRREAPSDLITSTIISTAGSGTYTTTFVSNFYRNTLYWAAFLCTSSTITVAALVPTALSYIMNSISPSATTHTTHFYATATSLPNSLANALLSYGTGNVPVLFVREAL